jgi:hypothetical protein
VSGVAERRPAAAKQLVPEPPGWRVVMVYGPQSPCNYFAHVVLGEAFRLPDELVELAIRTALAGKKAPIRTCGRDIAETLARRGNEVVVAARRRYCQRDCEIDFVAEPLK